LNEQFSSILRYCPNLHMLSVSSIYKEEYNETLEELFNPMLYSTLRSYCYAVVISNSQ